ncbi:ABC transporter permease [Spiractinospora alimapuensis]|nr:ABC transporter permease [Spiractinospora alimapuensis]
MKRYLVHPAVLTGGAVAFGLLIALCVTSLVFLASGVNPGVAFGRMLEHGTKPNVVVTVINGGTTLYLAGVAVAIGFKMRLFNIGVDGQYRLAAMLAAVIGGYLTLPPVLHQIVIVLAAMAVGAFWAGLAGLLKVTRGVHEVISTIMLNFIATGIVAYLLHADRLAERAGNNVRTPIIPESGQVAGFPGEMFGLATPRPVFGLVLLAAAVGVGYWLLLNRTRFGFDLRATGQSATAAEASGVPVRRMVFISMLISGAIAGLVGIPQLLGESHTYSLDFPAGLGFTGIAIALLGRNHPVGIAAAALFWSFLDQSASVLTIDGIPREIAVITQAAMVLSVVIVYEVVHRWARRFQQEQVSSQLDRSEAQA